MQSGQKTNANNNDRVGRRNSRFFPHNLLTAPRTVSNPYAQVARAQSRATHRALITCNTSSAYHVQHVVCHVVRRVCPKDSSLRENFYCDLEVLFKGRHGSNCFTKLMFESGYKFSVRADASVSVEVVVTRKNNILIGNFACSVLQCPLVLTSLEASLVFTTVSTLKHSSFRTNEERPHPALRGGRERAGRFM